MIVYYAMTKFHLIFTIVHKLNEHAGEDAVLYLYWGMNDREKIGSRLQEMNIFREIYALDEIEIRKEARTLSIDSSSNDIEYNIKYIADRAEAVMPYKISKSDKIYITNDQWAIGTYCIYHNIPYCYYEDGVGMLSRPDYSLELVRKLNVSHAIMAQYMKAFGQNKNVIKKLADMNNQQPGFEDELAYDYCITDRLRNLEKENIDKLLYVFDTPQIELKTENGTVLLTEHFINMKRLSIEGQRELYAMLVDYFSGKNKLFIKKHPNDNQLNYNRIFPDAEILQQGFPSELLPFCLDGKNFDLGLAACSTSVLGLRPYFKRIVRFDINIENTYQCFHKYYLLSQLLKRKIFSRYHIVSVNMLNDQLEMFMGMANGNNIYDALKESNEKKGKCILMDDWGEDQYDFIQQMTDEDILIYLNSKSEFNIFRYYKLDEAYNKFACIKITKRPMKNCLIEDCSSEYIYCFAGNEKTLKYLKEINMSKKLNYSGIDLNFDGICSDQETHIKYLEGYLASVLRTLEIYKEKLAGLPEIERELEECKTKLRKYSEIEFFIEKKMEE